MVNTASAIWLFGGMRDLERAASTIPNRSQGSRSEGLLTDTRTIEYGFD